jgi:hypothetical protein
MGGKQLQSSFLPSTRNRTTKCGKTSQCMDAMKSERMPIQYDSVRCTMQGRRECGPPSSSSSPSSSGASACAMSLTQMCRPALQTDSLCSRPLASSSCGSSPHDVRPRSPICDCTPAFTGLSGLFIGDECQKIAECSTFSPSPPPAVSARKMPSAQLVCCLCARSTTGQLFCLWSGVRGTRHLRRKCAPCTWAQTFGSLDGGHMALATVRGL